MTNLANIFALENQRGARYFVSAAIRRDEYTYAYPATGEEAEGIRARYEEQGLYSIKVTPPVPGMDVAKELDRLRRDRTDTNMRLHEINLELRGAVNLAAKQGFSEADIARRAGVDRMTVRSWLGKDKAKGK